MHLAAQYLRVVLLFFSYGDKRFWSPLRFDSRNFSLSSRSDVSFPSSSRLLSVFYRSHDQSAFCPSLSDHLCFNFFFVLFFPFFPLRVHKSSFKPFSRESKVPDFDKSRSTDKPLRSETKTCLAEPYVRGTPSWECAPVQGSCAGNVL